MKVSLLCICLFICLSGCTPAFAKEEELLDLYRDKVRYSTIENASDISKEISIEINKIKDELLQLTPELKQVNDEIDGIIPKKQRADQTYQSQKEVSKLLLTKTQNYYPYGFKDVYQLLNDYSNDNYMMNELKSAIDEKNRIDEQYKTLINRQSSISHEMQIKQNTKNELFENQRVLFEKFNDQIEKPNNDDGYNIHKMIQGNVDLPEYSGSITAYKYQNNDSCLVAGDYSIDSYSLSWLSPIENGTISAGTWSYPNGGMHLGVDIASDMYSYIRAPANAIILYADAPVDSNNGYLGNWCGWPSGGGNTICMICAVNDKLYGVTMAHVSNEIYVYPAQQVFQGDIIALSGNSGNSTGPHTHIEVFELQASLKDVVDYFIEGADFSFKNGFDMPETCSDIACRIRPETVF